MALIFAEPVPRAEAFAPAASKHVVEKSVVASLYGQHFLIAEWFEKVVEVGVDEAEGHAGGKEVELIDYESVQLHRKGHKVGLRRHGWARLCCWGLYWNR